MKLKSCDAIFTLQSNRMPRESISNLKDSSRVEILTYKRVLSTNGCEEKENSFSNQVIMKLTHIDSDAGKITAKDDIELKEISDSLKQESAINQTMRTRPYPKAVISIIANEFCERFSFYGLRTVLVLYLKNVLDFDDSKSTILFHLFAALCYIMPIFGAILADSVWGKFKTILYLSIVYLIGEIILIISSIFWDRGHLSTALTFFGLIMIGLGTGGIKPCVAPFGGDQFLPHEEKWRQSFFSIFYGAINIGCMLGMFLAPMLKSIFQCVRRSDCYPVAFSVPGSLMLLAIVSFLAAKNKYVQNPLPEQNIIFAFFKCIRIAIKRKLAGDSIIVLDEPVTKNGQAEKSTSNEEKDKNQTGPTPESDRKKCWLHLAADKFSEENIQNFRSVLHAFLILIPIPMFYCLHDQQGSLWTLQANRMDGRVINTVFSFEPDQIIVANPIVVLLAIPILDLFIYPFLSKRGILVKPVKRMTLGGILTALAFVASALIELHIQRSLPDTTPCPGQSNLLLVNGLNRCSITSPSISHMNDETEARPFCERLEPLSSFSLQLVASSLTSSNNYQLEFKLDSGQNGTDCLIRNPKLVNELDIKSIPMESMKLLYLRENDNGKLNYYLFNESLQLPKAGKTRIRLLYITNAALSQAKVDRFSLVRASENKSDDDDDEDGMKDTHFIRSETRHQSAISEYKEVGLPTKGNKFIVYFDDRSIKWINDNSISLKTGTRNLIIVQHDVIKQTMSIHHLLLQDNDYYISMLYQLIPYILISVAEVMIAVTGISCLYSMAPETMKAVIFGAWFSTLALGNLLTVLLESTITFSDITNKFLFYAALMALDSMLLSYIGSNF